jgi:hypothetical protein
LVDGNYREFDSEEAVLAALRKESGKGVPGNSTGAAKIIWQFVDEVKVNDVVIASKGYNDVLGIGVVTSEYLPPKSGRNPLRSDTSTHRHHVRLVNWIIAKSVHLTGNRFFIQSTIWPLNDAKLNRIQQVYAAAHPDLKTKLEQVLIGYRNGVSGVLPEEVPDARDLIEGAVHKITVNAYERNPEAREKCIATHGTACCICGFNFGATYGPDAEGYIHVHHLRALSEVNGEYVVDPIEDLRPVCPNCHAAIHLGGGCRSIAKVKKLLRRASARRIGGTL